MIPATHATAIEEITKATRDLLTFHWEDIIDTVEDNKASVAITVRLDLSGAAPAGAINISYSHKVKDAVTFRVEDPKQEKLKGVLS